MSPLVRRGEREGRPHQIEAAGPAVFKPGEERPKCKEQEKAQQSFGNGEAREEERSERGEDSESQHRGRRGAPHPREVHSQASQARPRRASVLGRWVEKTFWPKIL